MSRTQSYALQLFLLIAFSGSAHAVTYYVEGFGDDSNTCRSYQQPCKTISGALNSARTRDRVIVGDGVYNERIELPYVGMKLLSRRGAAATIIDNSGPNGGPAVVIANDQVRVGQKNRGFTVRGGGSFPALWVVGKSAIVEDNVVVAAETDSTSGVGDAINVALDRATVRFNTTVGNISLRPLAENIVAIAGERVTDNLLIRGNISIQSTTPLSRNLVQNNEMLDGSIFSGGVTEYSPTGVLVRYASNDRFIGNKMSSTAVISDGRYAFERNTARGLFTSDSNSSIIRHNSLLAPGFIVYGVLVTGDTADLTIQSNVISGVRVGVLLSSSDVSVRPIRSNNFWNIVDCPYFFNELPVTSSVKAGGNFYGSAGMPDLSCSGEGSAALASGLLTLSPRNSPNSY